MYRRFITGVALAFSTILVGGLISCSTVSSDDSDSGADTDTDTKGDPDCPEQEHFLDVSKAVGPGASYDAPQLDAWCEGDTLVVESNGLPHYTFVPITPNPLVTRDWHWEVTRSPQVADESTSLPLLGYAGFAVNGVPFYGPNEAAVPDPYGDPIYNEIMDGCMGHVGAEYHNHALYVKCLIESSLVETPWTNPEPSPSEPSPIVGYAADGFPIYGPYGCLDEECSEVVEFKSSWVQIGDPSTYAWDAYQYQEQGGSEYLDRCNGRTGADGSYRYHTTATFPYIMGCYSGTPSSDIGGDGGGGGNGPQTCEDNSDCVDACPAGSLDCVCHETPRGDKLCVPTCEKDEDCPVADQPLTCNEEQGICVPG